CAHCVEGYVAKVEEPCQTYDDVEPPAKHDIGHDEDGDIDELPIACREEVHRGKRQDQREDTEYAQHPFAEVRNRLCEAAEPCTHRRCCWTLDIEHEEIQRQSTRKDDSDGDDPGAPAHLDVEPAGRDIRAQTDEEEPEHADQERSDCGVTQCVWQLAAFFVPADTAHARGISAISRHFSG